MIHNLDTVAAVATAVEEEAMAVEEAMGVEAMVTAMATAMEGMALAAAAEVAKVMAAGVGTWEVAMAGPKAKAGPAVEVVEDVSILFYSLRFELT